MRQAITTKYLPPSNTKGARIKVSCQAKSTTVHWDDALDVNANHDRAALHLAELLGWHGRWHGGALPSGAGNCYVLVETAFTFEVGS